MGVVSAGLHLLYIEVPGYAGVWIVSDGCQACDVLPGIVSMTNTPVAERLLKLRYALIYSDWIRQPCTVGISVITTFCILSFIQSDTLACPAIACMCSVTTVHGWTQLAQLFYVGGEAVECTMTHIPLLVSYVIPTYGILLTAL